MPIITGRSPSNDVIDVALDETGAVKTVPVEELLEIYKLTDLDTTTDPQYFGFTDKEGNWYIMKLTDTTARYVKGTSGYTTAWTGRSGLSYDYFYNVF